MSEITYAGHRFPPEIIQQAIWLYVRFTLVTWEMPVVLEVSLRWWMRDRLTPGQKSPAWYLVRLSIIQTGQPLGRKASPIAQGRLEMDAIVVGIDVSKDKLDIAVLPQGEVFATSRGARGLEGLIARLKPLALEAVAVEATGGFETVVCGEPGSRGAAGHRRQSGASSRLRQSAWPARQNRSDRCHGHRSFHHGNEAGNPPASG
jgi:hypothetical protein